MCGFAGIVYSKCDVMLSELSVIAGKVNFRGPDYSGFRLYADDFSPRSDRGVHAFFHNRLSILDLDTRSNQPFEDDRYLLLYNGEIYNYRELREEMEGNGIIFKTRSDTEVLFESLKIWGEDTLIKLNGMFAFAFIDKIKQTILLGRDRFGIKPLYYCFENGSMIFGSELDSIIRLCEKKPEINTQSVEMYLVLQYVPAPHTIVKGIYKLLPGHYLAVRFDDIRGNWLPNPENYWDAYQQVLQVDGICDDLEDLLAKSVKSQLQADVPVGMFLSSGVDSSLLTAVMNKYVAQDQECYLFTVVFDELTPEDEFEDAKAFISGFNNSNLHHEKLELTSQSLKGKLLNLYNYLDEPFADHAFLLNWAIAEKARRHVKVVLSGDGGDELFYGYPRYQRWLKLKDSKKRLSSIIYIPIFAALNKIYPSKRLFLSSISNPVELYWQLLNPNFPEDREITSMLESSWVLQNVSKIIDRDDLPSLLDIKSYLPDGMFYKVDRSSMAASLEVRVPYTDNKIANFALSLSIKDKSTKQFQTKAPLKNLLKKLAPHYSNYKIKKGFNFPVKEWMLNDWKDIAFAYITKANFNAIDLDGKKYIALRDRFYKGEHYLIYRLWFVLNLILWFEKYRKIR